MLTLGVDVRSAAVVGMLKNGERRLAYALAGSLNDTILAAQAAERLMVLSHLTVRKREFIQREIAIVTPKASPTAGRFEARMHIGEKKRMFLTRLELGGVRMPESGKKFMAVPLPGAPARPSFAASVPEPWFVKELHLKRQGRSIRGENRTYLVPGVGIFTRVGGSSVEVYAFKRAVPIHKRLTWEGVAEEVSRRVFPRFLSKQVNDSFLHAAGLK